MMAGMKSRHSRLGSVIAVLGILGGCQLADPEFSDNLDRLLEMRDTIGTEVEGYYTPEEMAEFRAETQQYLSAVRDVTVRHGQVTRNVVAPGSGRAATRGNRSL